MHALLHTGKQTLFLLPAFMQTDRIHTCCNTVIVISTLYYAFFFSWRHGPSGPSRAFYGAMSPSGPARAFYGATDPSGPARAFYGATSPSGPARAFYGATDPSGPARVFYSATDPSGPGRAFYGATAPSGSGRAFYGATAPSGSGRAFYGATAPSGPGRGSSLSRLHSHTQTLHARFDFSGRVISEDTETSTCTTHNIRKIQRIQTRSPTKRAAVDPRLTSRGHWDHLTRYIHVHITPLIATFSGDFQPACC